MRQGQMKQEDAQGNTVVYKSASQIEMCLLQIKSAQHSQKDWRCASSIRQITQRAEGSSCVHLAT